MTGKINYWQRRAANEQWRLYNRSASDAKELIKLYEKANNKIQLELFELEKKAARDGVLTRSDLYRGKHLEKLNRSMTQTLNELGQQTERVGTEAIEQVAKDIYGFTADSLGFPIRLGDEELQRLMQVNWRGSNFSKRVWKNRKKLELTLNETLKKGIATGQNTTQLSLEIKRALDSSLYEAARLVRTETMHQIHEASMAAMRETGVVEKVRDVVTLDERTSDQCSQHADKVYEIDKAPMLPRHPNCRCVLVPEIDVDKIAAAKIENPDSGYESIKKDLDALDITKATHTEVLDLGRRIDELYDIQGKVGDPDAINQVLSRFRDMGGRIPKESFAKYSSTETKKELSKAFSHYPADWAKLPKAKQRQIYTLKCDRGFFTQGAVKANGREYATKLPGYAQDYVTINLSQGSSVAYHEIGHMIEFFDPNVIRIEKSWIRSRTASEMEVALRDLFPGWGYRTSEVTKKDQFVSPYIGKEYPNATEVLSMGLEGIYSPGKSYTQGIDKSGHVIRRTIKDDPEFLHLIIGLVLKGGIL